MASAFELDMRAPGVHRRRWRAMPGRLWRYLHTQFAETQLLIEFPPNEIRKHAEALPPLPPNFALLIPRSETDYVAWIALLNQETSFGHWTRERLQRDILARMVPDAALMILDRGQPISCACAIDASTARRKIAVGMFLYVMPQYRARSEIAATTTFRMLYQTVSHGYDQVVATTDPERLSAIALYLSNGSRPVRRTLRSWLQWRRVLKRLRPTLAKLAARKARRAKCATAG
jgi:hypothetical protein